jgi:hypothetical protein
VRSRRLPQRPVRSRQHSPAVAPVSSRESGLATPHITHGTNTPTLPTNAIELLAAMDQLTSVDRVIFKEAIRLFFRRVRAVEVRRGVTFLCYERLHELQPQLAYIVPNLVELLPAY